jgi:hypothetical protein
MINERLGAEIVEGKPYTTIGGEQVLPAVLSGYQGIAGERVLCPALRFGSLCKLASARFCAWHFVVGVLCLALRSAGLGKLAVAGSCDRGGLCLALSSTDGTRPDGARTGVSPDERRNL